MPPKDSAWRNADTWEHFKDWCSRNAKHPDVLAWLKNNPPPLDWKGTPTEYAYTEMWGAPK